MLVGSRTIYLLPKAFYTRGTLLEKTFIEKLCALKTLDKLIEELSNTAYKKYLEPIEPPYQGILFEKALRRRLLEYEIELLRVATGATRNFILSYFRRYEYEFLAYMLRLKYLGKKIERGQALSRIDPEVVKMLEIKRLVNALIEAENIEECLKVFKRYGLEKEASLLKKLLKIRNIFMIDLSMDKAFYEGLLNAFQKLRKGERKILREIMRIFIEGYNVILTLRGVLWGLPEEVIKELVLYSPMLESRLIVPPKWFKLSTYKEKISEIVKPEINFDKLSPLQIKTIDDYFRKKAVKEAFKLYRGKIFSVAPAFASILLLENEVLNLIKIAYGIERRVKPEVILRALIL